MPRYAVIGLGHIAQVAVLPGFKNAKNSELVALVSADPEKQQKLAQQYNVEKFIPMSATMNAYRRGSMPSILHCRITCIETTQSEPLWRVVEQSTLTYLAARRSAPAYAGHRPPWLDLKN